MSRPLRLPLRRLVSGLTKPSRTFDREEPARLPVRQFDRQSRARSAPGDVAGAFDAEVAGLIIRAELRGDYVRTGTHRLISLMTLAALLIVGCTGAQRASVAPTAASRASPAAALPSIEPTTQPPIDESVAAVSASKPRDEAAKVLAKCNIGEHIPLERVTGMGKIPSAGDLARYVPLTGRERQLKESGPAWVVTIDAEVPQPGSTELWINPTCVVTDGDAGWYATGPVTDLSTGKTMLPEKPARPPEFRVPPLVP